MTEEMPSDKLVFLDVETSGLKPNESLLLEVGLRVTDLDLKTLDSFYHVIGWSANTLKLAIDRAPTVVQNMHRDNGLWHECADEPNTVSDVDTLCVEWAKETSTAGYPLAGSSLRLDRDFLEHYMPETAELFHYRSIDNSSTKELCRRYNPELYAQMPNDRPNHRVVNCLDGTIREFRWYLDNFLFDGREADK